MGNCCGTSSSTSNDAFATPGRTLGSAPPPTLNAAPVPNRASKPPPKVGGPPRTVGGAGQDGDGDARNAAARAAEARANRSESGGKLAANLAAQRRQTGRETLEQVSREERGTRAQDEGAEARAYN